MKYTNPVLLSDFSEPDVIRVGKDFYMAASSYNLVPAIPILHSKNLVEWKLINYVLDEIPFERYNSVRHGEGAGAPSIRYHNGKYYCLVGFPEEGIFVSETDDPRKKWSPLRPLVEGRGLKDPCPLWVNDRCYVVFAFDKNNAGMDSQLAVFEANGDLTAAAARYTVIYDGHNSAPKIEGPKLYRHGKYFYITAAAGGAVNGWQVELRSPDIFGPYESKVILMQGDTDFNEHHGALVDLDDEVSKFAFVHYQDMKGYGKAVCVQPAVCVDDWILSGRVEDFKLAGTPQVTGDYPADVETDYCIDPVDEFDGEKLSRKWRTPANRADGWYEMKRGLKLNCVYHGASTLSDVPQLFMQKIPYLNFSVKTKCRLNLVNDGDETGFFVFGREYAYICVVRQDGQNYLEIRKGTIGGASDETLCRSQPYDENYVTFQISAKYEDRHKLAYKFTFGGSAFTHKFYASRGVNSGAAIGIYARSSTQSKGSGTFKFFRAVCTDNRVSKN